MALSETQTQQSSLTSCFVDAGVGGASGGVMALELGFGGAEAAAADPLGNFTRGIEGGFYLLYLEWRKEELLLPGLVLHQSQS